VQFSFAIPGDINNQTGGYIYDRRLMQELKAQGLVIDHLRLGDSFPNPTDTDMASASKELLGLPVQSAVIIDGLALGVLDPEIIASMQVPFLALVHHPLAHESGLTEQRRDYLFETERKNLSFAAQVVVTSPHTKDLLVSNYQVPAAKITVVPPGIDHFVVETRKANPPLVLSVGIQVFRKGHDVFLEALSKILDLDWQAVVVGKALDPEYAADLQRLVAKSQLEGRVSFTGQISDAELAKLYGEASVFALATRYEGFGMVFGEAMLNGLPIISCRTGAVPETVASGAGVFCEPDDPAGFAMLLRELLTNSGLMEQMSKASAKAGAELPSWEQVAKRFGQVLDNLQDGIQEKQTSGDWTK